VKSCWSKFTEQPLSAEAILSHELISQWGFIQVAKSCEYAMGRREWMGRLAIKIMFHADLSVQTMHAFFSALLSDVYHLLSQLLIKAEPHQLLFATKEARYPTGIQKSIHVYAYV
jgi:hypothetical protein